MIPKLFVLLVNHTAKQIVPVRQRIKDNYPQFSLIFDNFRRTKKNCLQLLIIVDLLKSEELKIVF